MEVFSEILGNIGGILLFAIGITISIGNWAVFISGVRGKGSASFCPIVGGVCLFWAFSIQPFDFSWQLSLISFLIDFGSIPWMVWLPTVLIKDFSEPK